MPAKKRPTPRKVTKRPVVPPAKATRKAAPPRKRVAKPPVKPLAKATKKSLKRRRGY
jgi:hypothetical protein